MYIYFEISAYLVLHAMLTYSDNRREKRLSYHDRFNMVKFALCISLVCVGAVNILFAKVE